MWPECAAEVRDKQVGLWPPFQPTGGFGGRWERPSDLLRKGYREASETLGPSRTGAGLHEVSVGRFEGWSSRVLPPGEAVGSALCGAPQAPGSLAVSPPVPTCFLMLRSGLRWKHGRVLMEIFSHLLVPELHFVMGMRTLIQTHLQGETPRLPPD